MELKIILGLVAGSLATLAFLPQVIKTFKTKDTESISLLMCITLCTGLLLWMVYGFILGNKIIIFFNSVSLGLNLAILGMKIKYK